MDNEILKQRIHDAEVVSFDIFDTLIVRLYGEPTDLFYHLEKALDIPGFAHARIEGEFARRKEAEKNGIQEVTIFEIYEQMSSTYHFMMEHEMELETLMCRQNPEMMEYFEYAKQLNKRIVVASDMYLPKATIELILEKAGYVGYTLFLSSDTRRPKKNTGEMYDDIIQYAGVSPDKILHIGDHPFTDGVVPRTKGVQDYVYFPVKYSIGATLNSQFFALLNRYKKKYVTPAVLQGMITRNSLVKKDQDYWYHAGYNYAGILAYSYVVWLYQQFKKDKIDKAYFMLRDGHIFYKVFKKLYPDFPAEEINGSRRMFLFSGMKQMDDIKELLFGLHAKGPTYDQFYQRLFIEDERLTEEYVREFPDQQQMVRTDQEIKRLEKFFVERESALLAVSKREREEIMGYFQSCGVLEGRSAIVDLGWKGSMLKGMERACAIEKVPCQFYGYYVGTHKFEQEGIRATGFAMNNCEPSDLNPYKSLVNYGFIIPVFELLFSAPHPSVLKMKKAGKAYEPVYQTMCPEEQERQIISSIVENGVLDFAADFCEICTKYPLQTNAEIALLPFEYLSDHISKYDEKKFSEVPLFVGLGNDMTNFPISRTGHHRFGVVYPWPETESAESELLERIKRAASDVGMECVLLSDHGKILDENQRETNISVDPDTLDFVMTTHYESAKLIDAFSYHLVWNPPEIPLNTDYYADRVVDNYLMNDDFLIYDFGGMSNHLKCILMNKPRSIEGASTFVGSFPQSVCLEPNLHDPKLFYCGMNWEKVVLNANRHEGLFKLLDDTGAVRFFGPEIVMSWGGVRPWDGYKCYQGSLPFDGFSILKEINRCGICLAISSDFHRRAGAVTNRTYEACAAGAVIITDNNVFMEHYFRDAALFIDYNKNNPADTFKQIMEKYQWVIDHPAEALAMARNAQQIFKDNFCMDKQLCQVVKNHPKRFSVISNDLFAQDINKRVLVTYVINTLDMRLAKQNLSKVIHNVEHQYYRNIVLGIACDYRIWSELKLFCDENCMRVQLTAMSLFDIRTARAMTNGQAIRKLQQGIPHDFFVNTLSHENWYYDHITTLIRSVEEVDDAWGAYSGLAAKDRTGHGCVKTFQAKTAYEYLTPDDNLIYNPGMFLFSANAHKAMPDYLFDCLDGLEHVAYSDIILMKEHKKLVFSKRMTFSCNVDDLEKAFSVLSLEMQKKFTEGLVKYEMPAIPSNCTPVPQTTYSSVALDRKTIADMFSLWPIKTWLKMRYYRRKMQKANPKSEKCVKYSKKYEETLQRYNDYWSGK